MHSKVRKVAQIAAAIVIIITTRIIIRIAFAPVVTLTEGAEIGKIDDAIRIDVRAHYVDLKTIGIDTRGVLIDDLALNR